MGLVGQITADHVFEALDMTFFGSVHCPGLPQVTAYEEGDTTATCTTTPRRSASNANNSPTR
ncbi:PAC2 family protein [Halorussus salinus]|uniref:PAC2 family protein n=1 Tax=Halorussus salinus TaxID=1364935 RepID=UPI001EE4AFD2|nr:PAC2 family protein [Halorussus salinus]